MHKGNHILVDCKNVSEKVCLDDKKMLDVMAWAASEAGMTVISQVRYKFDEENVPGFTTAILLSESHCTSHSYANSEKGENSGQISLDIFTCGEIADPAKVLELIRSKIDLGNDITVTRVKRFIIDD